MTPADYIVASGLGLATWLHRHAVIGFTRTRQELHHDLWAHIAMAEDIRRAGHRIPERLPSFVMPGKMVYPGLLHWVLSYLPRERRIRLNSYFTAALDTVAVVVVYLAARHVAKVYLGVLHPVILAAATAATVGFVPLIAPTPLFNARMSLSARPVGELLVLLSLVGLASSARPGHSALFALAAACLTLALLGSRFAMQVVIGFALVSLLMFGDATLAAAALAAIAVGAIVTRGYLLRVMWGNVRYLHHYCVVVQKRHVLVKDRAVILSLRSFRRQLARGRRYAAANLLSPDHTLLYTLLHFSPLLPFLWVVYRHGLNLASWSAPELRLYYEFGVGALVLFALTSLPPFRFLGEAERYFAYGAFPIAFLVAVEWVARPDLALKVLIAAAVGLVVVVQMLLMGYSIAGFSPNEGREEKLRSLLEFLSTRPATTTLCIPFRNAAYFAAHVQRPYLFHQLACSTRDYPRDYCDTLFQPWEFLTPRGVAALIEQYSPGSVIVEREELDQLTADVLSKKGYRSAYDTGDYAVFERPDRFFVSDGR